MEISSSSVPSDPEGNFRFNGVNYDQIKGLGSVPDNQNIIYKGFAVTMEVRHFMALAKPVPKGRDSKADSVEYLKDFINQGGAIGCPFLQLDVTKNKIVGHEGRHRCLAVFELFQNMNHEVVVHVFPRAYRARHITLEMIKAFSENPISEKGIKIKGPVFNQYYHIDGWKTMK